MVAADPISLVFERLADRVREDDGLAETLAFLAEDDVAVDPFARPSGAVLSAARRVNNGRASQRRTALAEGALTTSQVVELIGSMSDRRAVDRRRRRGGLLGVKTGNTVWHPAWQFDQRSGDTRPGLRPILEALAEVTGDPVAANAFMTAPHPELAGRAIADVFADGDINRAVTVIRLGADQS